MFEKGMYLMHYKLGVVKVVDVAFNPDLGGLAYFLISKKDNLEDSILVTEKTKQPKLRELVKESELNDLIAKQNMLSDKLIKNRKDREYHYNDMSLYGTCKDILITVKRYHFLLETYYPTYISQKEHQIFAFAKDKLCQEVSFVLGIDYNDVIEYIFKTKEEKKQSDHDDDSFFVL